jgi:signal transduction histidine kinase
VGEPGAANRPDVLPHLRLDELLAELQGRVQAVLGARDQMRGLLEAVVAIGSGLDLESTLRRIVETAVGLVDASYGAMGVIGDEKRLAEFIPVGLGEDEIREIHHWPEGRGLLGLLIDDPRPLRLADIVAHPASSGFPEGHPPMRGFLGVPVRVRDVVFGNLYLTGKRGGTDFTEDDEAVLIALGTAAGVAIENARLYEAARRQQRWIQASAEVTTRLLSGSSPAEVLADVTQRVRELSGADLAMLALPDEDGRRLTIAHADGDGAEDVHGLVLPAGQSLSGQVLATGEPVTAADFAVDDRASSAARGAMSQIGPAIVFPLGAPGNVRGVLTVGRRHGAPPFPLAQAEVVASFAAQAGVALELAARRADAERLSLYEDRDRIARDLHDLVIQRLYATGMSLQGTMPMVTRPEVATRIGNAVDAMDDTIKDIRVTIFALQARGVAAEPDVRGDIVGLVEEMTPLLGFAPSLRLGAGLGAQGSGPVSGEVSDQALAALREALSNAARHSGATQVDVTVDTDSSGFLTVLVTDDGTGISPGGRRSGLRNLASRAEKLGGELLLDPVSAGTARPGTRLEWRVPRSLPSQATAVQDARGDPDEILLLARDPGPEADRPQPCDICGIGHLPGLTDRRHAPAASPGGVEIVRLERHHRVLHRRGELAARIGPDHDVPAVKREVHQLHRGECLPGIDDAADRCRGEQLEALTRREAFKSVRARSRGRVIQVHRGRIGRAGRAQ